MLYDCVCQGIFRARPNRFIAEIEVEGQTEIAHVKNTGRCKELLIPGAKVILQKAGNPSRRTQYDLIAVWKGERLINMDSQAPNKVFLEYLRSGRYIENITLIKAEAVYGNSRIDFYVEAGTRKIFMEVKGVTLEESGVALFPDAPTQRGVKHLNTLAASIGEGYEAHVVFVVQMRGVVSFAPNNRTHPDFGAALVSAEAAGVEVSAFDCEVAPDSLVIGEKVTCRLRT